MQSSTDCTMCNILVVVRPMYIYLFLSLGPGKNGRCLFFQENSLISISKDVQACLINNYIIIKTDKSSKKGNEIHILIPNFLSGRYTKEENI